MSGIDNKKLDLLLSLRELIRNEESVARNNSVRIDSFYMKDYDNESADIYFRLQQYIKVRYEQDKVERERLLHDINSIIDRTCDHEFIDDEIEHVYSGSLTKIRYCCICEKTD